MRAIGCGFVRESAIGMKTRISSRGLFCMIIHLFFYRSK